MQQPWGQSQPQQPVQQPWGQSQPQQPVQQWGQSQPQWPQQGQPGPQDWNQQSGQQWPQQQAPAGKKKTGMIVGIVAVVVVVLAGAVVGLTWLLSKDQLDNKAVQTGVQKVLKDSYGIDDVQDVSCPSGEKVQVDKTFDCTLKVGGESKKVTIKITKDDGTYEVGRPS
ncbi:membrane protein [Nocardia seriolae]|nr:membrane protein [Nocardia seriolae]